MVTGRPREYDRELIAQQMIEWVKRDNSINMCGFCSEYWVPYSRMWSWADEDEQFRDVMEMVKLKIAQRREEWVSAKLLHQTAYGMNARVYDKPMHKYYREDAKYQSELKKEEVNAVPVKTTEHFESLMNQLDGIQEQSKALLINLNSNNASS